MEHPVARENEHESLEEVGLSRSAPRMFPCWTPAAEPDGDRDKDATAASAPVSPQ